MVQKLDRVLIIAVSVVVALNAIVGGWQIMTSGSVFGFALPRSWLTSAWPFGDYTVAGVLLLVVIGGGCAATAIVNIASARAGAVVALAMGAVLAGWIAGEVVFFSQTMIMTWAILGSGILLIVLAAPYALPQISGYFRRRLPGA